MRRAFLNTRSFGSRAPSAVGPESEDRWHIRLACASLFATLLLCGCDIGGAGKAAILRLPLTPPRADQTMVFVSVNDPSIRDALDLVDLVLKRNDFEFKNDVKHLDQITSPHEILLLERRYRHHHKRFTVNVSVCFSQMPDQKKKNERISRDGVGQWAGSKEVLVVVLDGARFYTPRPLVQRVRDELAQELEKRFGVDKVSYFDGINVL